MLSTIMAFWTGASQVRLQQAEDVLLKQAKTPVEHRFVKCNERGDRMHTIICGDPSKKPLVLTHGYGAGAAFWNLNLDHLSEHFRVYAVDWLGCGRSDRPKYTAKNADQAEDFFLDSLEHWRTEMGLEKFVLAGHSLGGYLSCVYALRHPDTVESLVLVSPVGVPAPPNDEVTPPTIVKREHMSWKVRSLINMVHFFWKRNVTPQSIVRKVGYKGGYSLISRFGRMRFSHFPDDHREALVDYIYHTSALQGSGEYALGTLLRPFAWAYKPLIKRVHDLKVPVMFMYGDSDWMSVSGGEACKDIVDVPISVRVVPQAGHHLYMENPDTVTSHIVEAAFGYEYLQAHPPSIVRKGRPVMNRSRREIERDRMAASVAQPQPAAA